MAVAEPEEPEGSKDPDRSAGSNPAEPTDTDLPPLPPEWAAMVVPDDASALEAEAKAIREELAASRDHRLDRPVSSPDWSMRRPLWRRVPGTTLSLVIAAALACIASLVLAMQPQGKEPPQRSPLASTQSQPGTVGGLMPPVMVSDVAGRGFPVRAVRPALILLTGANCACGDLIRRSESVAAAGPVALGVITSKVQQPTTLLGVTRTLVMVDPKGKVARGVGLTPPAKGAAAVLVRSDGTIQRLLNSVSDPSQLSADVASLPDPQSN